MTTEPNNEPAQELSEKELEDISAGGKTNISINILQDLTNPVLKPTMQ